MKRPDHIPTVATLSRLKAGVYAHWRDRATSAVRVYVQNILTYVCTYVDIRMCGVTGTKTTKNS